MKINRFHGQVFWEIFHRSAQKTLWPHCTAFPKLLRWMIPAQRVGLAQPGKTPEFLISAWPALCVCWAWAGQLASLHRVKGGGAGEEPTDSWPTSIAPLWIHHAIWLPVELKTWKAEDSVIWDSPCLAPEVPNFGRTRTIANENSTSPAPPPAKSSSGPRGGGKITDSQDIPSHKCFGNQVSRTLEDLLKWLQTPRPAPDLKGIAGTQGPQVGAHGGV